MLILKNDLNDCEYIKLKFKLRANHKKKYHKKCGFKIVVFFILFTAKPSQNCNKYRQQKQIYRVTKVCFIVVVNFRVYPLRIYAQKPYTL